jgi:muramidase (phage lysozyme)
MTDAAYDPTTDDPNAPGPLAVSFPSGLALLSSAYAPASAGADPSQGGPAPAGLLFGPAPMTGLLGVGPASASPPIGGLLNSQVGGAGASGYAGLADADLALPSSSFVASGPKLTPWSGPAAPTDWAAPAPAPVPTADRPVMAPFDDDSPAVGPLARASFIVDDAPAASSGDNGRADASNPSSPGSAADDAMANGSGVGALPSPEAPPAAPSASGVSPETKALLDRIAVGEGGSEAVARAHGFASSYDVTLGNDAYAKPHKPLSQMTLAEVEALQTQILHNPRNEKRSSAVGRYQITRENLREQKQKLGLPNDAVFDAALQDKLGQALLQKRGLNDYLSGKIGAQQFQARLAPEWTSVADPYTGRTTKGLAPGTTTAQIQPLIIALKKH